MMEEEPERLLDEMAYRLSHTRLPLLVHRATLLASFRCSASTNRAGTRTSSCSPFQGGFNLSIVYYRQYQELPKVFFYKLIKIANPAVALPPTPRPAALGGDEGKDLSFA